MNPHAYDDDPLADVFPGTLDAPLPVPVHWRGWVQGANVAPSFTPHPDDHRWEPATRRQTPGGSKDTPEGSPIAPRASWGPLRADSVEVR